MSSTLNRIPHIDAWRFIAVTMVVICHILKFSNPWYREHLPWIIMARSQGLGQFGVNIFFCISGFVICRGLIAEKILNGSVSMKAFYVRRFMRILPPLAVYLAALYLLMLCEFIDIQPSQFVYAGLFLCNVDLGKCGWLLAHTWSLAYEEQFYLFFPVVFILSSVLGGRRMVLALTVAMATTSLLALYANLDTAAFAASTFTCMLAGCVSALYWENISPKLAGMSVFAWTILVGITYMIGCIVIWSGTIGRVLNALVVPLCICAMVLSTPVSSRTIAAFFLNPTITYLGKISFTIYLWQQLATSAEYIKSPWINFVALAATVLFGIFSYRYMERPLIRAGAALSRRMTVSRATVSPVLGATNP
jgi:peptidoglycan/LPS O-acetylase OafA/YrhL